MNIINIELTIKCIYYLNILFILYNSGICHIVFLRYLNHK